MTDFSETLLRINIYVCVVFIFFFIRSMAVASCIHLFTLDLRFKIRRINFWLLFIHRAVFFEIIFGSGNIRLSNERSHGTHWSDMHIDYHPPPQNQFNGKMNSRSLSLSVRAPKTFSRIISIKTNWNCVKFFSRSWLWILWNIFP